MPPKAASVLKEEVVQVVLPDGDVDVRLAKVDLDRGCLVLTQLSFDDDGEVAMGDAATVKLASIGAAVALGQSVKLHAGNASGRVLLELNFSGSPGMAKSWAEVISKASQSQARNETKATARSDEPKASPKASSLDEPKASPKAGKESKASSPGRGTKETKATPSTVSSLEGDASKMLKTLIQQQEEQVSLLEAIVEKKAEQLLQMQSRLEGALEKLQMGQEIYGDQQRCVELQAEKIRSLQAQLHAARSAEMACQANADLANRGASAAARAGGTGAVSQLVRGAGSAGVPPRNPPPSPAADEEEDEEAREESGGDEEEERMLVEKLRQLEAEKRQCEEQLRKEQSDIIAQTQALQSMMAALNIVGSRISSSDD
eukprot:TRINITY_DN32123_c0_g1_i1.p1 TRINITY_DN32123_c0_g1~~TRINITY_DN32123_c0_g1_i1.p1  ORF type:complete len:374 (-),score=119.13 TRINITY_DN32123_c0_g1_i1:172-1293(-)